MLQKYRNSFMGIFVASTLLSSVAFSMPPEDDDKMDKRMDKVEQQLNLTAEQKKVLEDHRKTHREQAKVFRSQIKEKMKLLAEELEKPELNMSQVQQIHGSLKDLHNQMADHRLQGILEVRKILSPEQFKKFQELTRKKWDQEKKEHQQHQKGKRSGGE